jgi:3-hydroxybutyryl-CoA dehydrogenase
MPLYTIAVCGAGTMGAAIAQIAAQSGFNTILFDVQEAALQKGKLQIETAMQKLVDKNKVTIVQATTTLKNIQYSTYIEHVKANCIIEAIVENLQAKVELFQKLMLINDSKTLYATNTSSISIKAIASSLIYKEQVVGIHFFNPATIMRLVEIIECEYSSKNAVNEASKIVEQMGKTTVHCTDFPGFIVNRVARHFYLESMYLAQNNLVSIKNIDDALQNAQFKMGPFSLMDLIGLDINYNVSNIVFTDLGKPIRLAPNTMQLEKVQSGKLGKKTGEGFYKY